MKIEQKEECGAEPGCPGSQRITTHTYGEHSSAAKSPDDIVSSDLHYLRVQERLILERTVEIGVPAKRAREAMTRLEKVGLSVESSGNLSLKSDEAPHILIIKNAAPDTLARAAEALRPLMGNNKADKIIAVEQEAKAKVMPPTAPRFVEKLQRRDYNEQLHGKDITL